MIKLIFDKKKLTLKIKFWWFLLTHDQVNASSITKITSFLGKNLCLVGCATVCVKSEVMLRSITLVMEFLQWRWTFWVHNTHFKCSLKFQNTIKSSNNMTEPKLFFGHYGSLKKLQLLHNSVVLCGLYVHRFFNGFWLKNDILNFLKHFIFLYLAQRLCSIKN
jgi:hypothetical protein